MCARPPAAVPDANARQAAVLIASDIAAEAAWLAATHRAASAGAWQWNLQTNTPEWSEGFYRLHRLDAARTDASFEAWLGALHPEDRPVLCEAARHAARGRERIDLEYRVGQAEPARWVQVKGRIVREGAGEAPRMAGIALEVDGPQPAPSSAIQMADSEQRRLQHALQDELGQQLTGILMKAQVLLERLESENSTQADYLERIIDLMTQAHGYTRDLARTLAPVVVRTDELGEALSQLAADTKCLFNVACWCEVSERLVASSDDVATRLYRFAAEAVEHAVQRVQVRAVFLELCAEGEQGVLRVTTTARETTADEDEAARASPEQELRALRRYASALGATLSVCTAARGETVLTCSFSL